MSNDDELLSFVKSKLEEREGVSPESLARLIAAAEESRTGHNLLMFFPRRVALAAASLAVAICGWYFVADSVNASRADNVSNVIALLSAADGDDMDSAASLSDALCSWQDAPTLARAD